MATLAGKALVPFEGQFSGLTTGAADAATHIGSSFAKLAPLALVGAIAAVVGVAIDMGAKFQKTTNEMAASAGITASAAANIGRAFLGTGGQTIYTAQEMMAALAPVGGQFEFINGKPLTLAQNLAVMRAAMALASATGSDLTSTTANLAKIMQAFGLPIAGAATAADILTNSAKALGVPVDTLATSLQRARTSAGAAAPSLGELSAFMLDLAAHGESGRGAVALLNSALTGIEVPTAKVLAMQKELGLSFINSKGQLDPLSKIIGEVKPKIEGMGNAQATAYLKSIGFGSASGKLVDLMQAGVPAFEKAATAVNKVGSAQADAALATSGLSGSFDKIKAKVIDQVTAWGTDLLPVVSTVAGFFAAELPVALGIASVAFADIGKWISQNHVLLTNIGNLIRGVVVAAFAALHTAIALVIDVVNFLSQHLDIFGPIIAGIVGGLIAWKVVTLAITAAQWAMAAATGALNAVMDANPIALIIIALAALGVGIALVITHFNQVKEVVGAVWDWIWSKISGIVGTIVAVFKVTPFGFFITHLTDIKNFVSTIVGDVIGFFTGLPKKIGDAIASVYDFLTAPFKLAFNLIASIWNATLGKVSFTIPGWVPGIGGDKFGFPTMPIWSAAGAFVDRPTLIGAGEGGPETVLNQRQFRAMMGGSSGGVGGGRGVTHNYVVNLYGTDEANLAKFEALIERNNAEVERANGLAA